MDYYDILLAQKLSGGGGSSIDFSSIKQDYSLQNIGGLFTAFENGTWGSLEYSCTSGTNPISINFGRAIKGLICYPKSKKVTTDISDEQIGFTICFYGDPNEETGEQTAVWGIVREKSAANTGAFPRTTNNVITNGVLSMIPTYPSNAKYHPFKFGVPYIFVYWW